jgi:TPR repeat protein
MAGRLKTKNFLIERRLADAARGDGRACYELGMVYSTGTAGVVLDLIEAHKWFNLAAVSGNHAAQECRAEDTDRRLTPRDWMQLTQRRAA